MVELEKKLGLFVCTYNRLDYLKQCIESLDNNNWGGSDIKGIVDDCSTQEGYKEYLDECENKGIIVIRKEENKGVGDSKNKALTYMRDDYCTHYFIMEDDILMKHKNTCHLYIDYAKSRKLEHLNFALHGEMNKGRKSYYEGICVYPHCVGAFSYYTRKCIEAVGMMDEGYHNAWEHVDHTFRCSLQGFTTPFWYFADIPGSNKLLDEIPDSIDNSVIRPDDNWQKNINKGKEHWIKKYKMWLPSKPYKNWLIYK